MMTFSIQVRACIEDSYRGDFGDGKILHDSLYYLFLLFHSYKQCEKKGKIETVHFPIPCHMMQQKGGR